VTYGTASAPYLATRCLQQLAVDEDFYVDDLMSGTSTPEQAAIIYQQLNKLLQSAGMELCKWASSSQEVMAAIPESSREVLGAVQLDHEQQQSTTVKALGVCCQPTDDIFSGLYSQPQRKFTKSYALRLGPCV